MCTVLSVCLFNNTKIKRLINVTHTVGQSADILDSELRAVEVPPTFRPETLSSDPIEDYELWKTPEFRLIMECAINPANHLTHLLQMFCKDKPNQPICQKNNPRANKTVGVQSIKSDVLF